MNPLDEFRNSYLSEFFDNELHSKVSESSQFNNREKLRYANRRPGIEDTRNSEAKNHKQRRSRAKVTGGSAKHASNAGRHRASKKDGAAGSESGNRTGISGGKDLPGEVARIIKSLSRGAGKRASERARVARYYTELGPPYSREDLERKPGNAS